MKKPFTMLAFGLASFTISAQNIGIGTTSPMTKLHVSGGNYDVSGTYGDYLIGNTTYGLRIGVSTESSPTVPGRAFIAATGFPGRLSLGHDANTTILNIVDGKVGVNTTTPELNLDVYNTFGYDARFGGNASSIVLDGENAFQTGGLIQTMHPATSAPKDLYLQPFGGLVGVGTVQPLARFHIMYDADVWHTFIGGSTGRLQIGGQTANGAVLQSYNPTSNTARDLYLQRDGGNVGIGNSSAAAKLHVTGTEQIDLASGISSAQLMLNQTDASYARLGFRNSNGRSWTIAASRGATVAADQMNFYNEQSGFDRLVLFGNGNATLSGTLTQNSDERLKRNISEVNGVLPQLEQLHAYSYYWKDASRGDEKQLGFLAQEIEKVYPELVRTDDKGYKSVAYQNFIPVLLQAVKEQGEHIEKLQKEIYELKNKKQ